MRGIYCGIPLLQGASLQRILALSTPGVFIEASLEGCLRRVVKVGGLAEGAADGIDAGLEGGFRFLEIERLVLDFLGRLREGGIAREKLSGFFGRREGRLDAGGDFLMEGERRLGFGMSFLCGRSEQIRRRSLGSSAVAREVRARWQPSSPLAGRLRRAINVAIANRGLFLQPPCSGQTLRGVSRRFWFARRLRRISAIFLRAARTSCSFIANGLANGLDFGAGGFDRGAGRDDELLPAF